jgi:hypothetical protein
MLDRGTGMFALLQKLIDAISALWTMLGWFGVTATIISLSTAAGGVIWAMVTGIAGPIVLMAAFCTITAGVYLALVPMAYRTLRRIQDMPIQVRPDPEIWRHVTTFRLSEAACLLADVEPDLAAVSKPGAVNAWYRAMCDSLKDGEIQHIRLSEEIVFRDGYYPHEKTIISRDDLKKFANKKNIRRAFLVDSND